MKKILILMSTLLCAATVWSQNALVFQSDFGTKDAAVASMKGVAFGVSPDLRMFDLTHEIPAYNVWEAAQRLMQTAEYWPAGTVFVSVVDPGVGTERKSVVMKTKTGHYFVTPDNGTLTRVAEELGVAALREIDEAVNRLESSENSYTFHGRDVYAYTGARLAAGVITFEEVGPELPPGVVAISYQKARFEDGTVYGNIPILDIQYGNIWTNIDRTTFEKLHVTFGEKLNVKITHGQRRVLETTMPYFATFGGVEVGESLLYLNSLNKVALAINQGNFAKTYKIASGAEWNIEIWK
ncbi:MAG: S-adenosyl-l-methionine hydroxide adenosyltransferase family protein [bacterium]